MGKGHEVCHFYKIKQSIGEARMMLREDITVEVGTRLKL